MRLVLAVLVLAVALVPFQASACSCVQSGTVQQEMAQSTRVFVGRVTAIEERTPQMDRGWFALAADWVKELFGNPAPPTERSFPYKRVSFAVIQTFKGAPAPVLQVATGTGGGDCGYFFEVGQEYVVYAHGSENALGAGICSLTGPASDPGSGLEILRNGS